MIAPYLASLNDAQREAVETVDGPVLVLSGAGTGKTRVLTTRIAHILQLGKAYPSEILAVTFTNKAAREMAMRAANLSHRERSQSPSVATGDAGEGQDFSSAYPHPKDADALSTSPSGRGNPGPITLPYLGTFHSIGAKILRKHAEALGFTSDFVILDTDDQLRLLKTILQERNIDIKKNPPKQYLYWIQHWKDRGLIPDKVSRNDVLVAGGGDLLDIYKEYQRRLRALNAMDFGDLLLHNLTLFTENQDILQSYAQRFRYILVDEYQDTNIAQYLWLRLLALGHKNICCVGDDDQSIYGWRGAEVGNILKFEQDFPGAAVVRLEQNYRSTPQILAAASTLIGYNETRLGKTLWTEGEDGEPLNLRAAVDSEEEAYLVGEKIEDMRRADVPYNEMAILVRAGFQTRQFEERLMTLGLPYQVVGGLRFYERQEIKDAICYLRVIQNPADNLAFERIINTPKRGVGKATLERMHSTARAEGISLYEATARLVGHNLSQWERSARPKVETGEGQTSLLEHSDQAANSAHPHPKDANALSTPPSERGNPRPKITGKVKDQLTHLLNLFDRWRHLMPHTPIGELTDIMLEESGYRPMWEKEKNAEANGRLENLRELVRAMGDFETLTAFLEHVGLVIQVTEQDANGTGEMVSLMTLHAAKGLEFDVVFLPGWEEGLFPHQRSLDESGQQGLEEERRLAYVGITRARKRVFISHAERRRFFTKGGVEWQSTVPSRFITELPPEHLESMDARTHQQHTRFRDIRQDFASEIAGVMEQASGSFDHHDLSHWERSARPQAETGEGQSHKLLSRKILENARDLRQHQTEPEHLLWSLLRNQQLGHKFRRQHPIDPYIVDFCCVEKKLIIELDGSQHNEAPNQQYDEKRDAYLKQQGFTVLRVWNNELQQNLEGVLTAILDKLGPSSQHPHPKSSSAKMISTSPSGRGISPGSQVTHPKFGPGVVIKKKEDTLEIAFKNGTTKRIMAEFVEVV